MMSTTTQPMATVKAAVSSVIPAAIAKISTNFTCLATSMPGSAGSTRIRTGSVSTASVASASSSSINPGIGDR